MVVNRTENIFDSIWSFCITLDVIFMYIEIGQAEGRTEKDFVICGWWRAMTVECKRFDYWQTLSVFRTARSGNVLKSHHALLARFYNCHSPVNSRHWCGQKYVLGQCALCALCALCYIIIFTSYILDIAIDM